MEKTGGYSMVEGNLAHKLHPEVDCNPLAPDPLKYTSVPLSEILGNHLRLEAGTFNIDAKAARYKVEHNPYGYMHLWGDNGLVKEAYNAGRFKRNYVNSLNGNSIGFLGSSEMLNIKPVAYKYITRKLAQQKDLCVKKGMVLLSCSGTIGNSTFVNATLEKFAFSQHIIRLLCSDYSGYIYACLNIPEVKNQILSNVYGAVILEIEPDHLKNIIIPNAPNLLKQQIHNLIVESYDLRDQSNELIDESEKLLYKELHLPPIEQLKTEYFDKSIELRNYSTKMSDLNLRLDCSYHTPLCRSIIKVLQKNAKTIAKCGDNNITKDIVLPTRFKRIYVDAKHGIKLIGGKQINVLNPGAEKYLAHSELDKELMLLANSILITRSGTIGKVTIVPKHWENWIGSDHIIRIIPVDNNIAGYLYCWLNTDYAQQLIKRNTFGSVVDEIDCNQLGEVIVPILKDSDKQMEINNKVLQANTLRYQAFQKEQEALKIMKDIIGA